MTLERIPRKIQRDAIAETLNRIGRSEPRGLWILPTGAGKTYAFVELVRCLNVRTLVLVHRAELVEQTRRHLAEQAPWLAVGVVQGPRNEWENDVVIAMVPSLSPARLGAIDRGAFPLVIVDECHHGAADRWTAAMQYFASAFRLGVTATPQRLDGRGLAEWFGPDPICNYTIRQAVADGVLCRIRQYALATAAPLDSVGRSRGDFVKRELSGVVNTEARNRAIVEAWIAHGENRKTIGFCVDVQHAADLALAFTSADIAAAYLDGSMSADDRAAILDRFRTGKTAVLLNCEILTEGFDDSSIACVIMARPTESKGLYVQCVGRGLRLQKGKADCLILDCADLSSRHRLVSAFDLAGKKRPLDREPDADGADLFETVEADELAEIAHQEEVRAHTGPLAWRLESVCPWPEMPTLERYRPRFEWESSPATEAQIKYLIRFGLTINRDLTKGEATYLIDQCKDYEAAYPTPPTEKQELFLRLAGRWEDGMTKREAGKLIGELKGQNA